MSQVSEYETVMDRDTCISRADLGIMKKRGRIHDFIKGYIYIKLYLILKRHV